MKGQLATENLDDCRKVYKTMTYQVLVNMKERERTLQIARQEVEELKDSTKLLVRIEVCVVDYKLYIIDLLILMVSFFYRVTRIL